MRKLMVNADDFGWSESVNRGIIDCHQRGIVTSTSLLATGSAFNHAVMLAKENPKLAVGVHLNFYRGKALRPETGPLAESVGRFVFGMLTGKYKPETIEQEFRAQIEKILSAGIRPRHLDSEKHLHHWPAIFRVVRRLAEEYGVTRVRAVNEINFSPVAIALSLLSRYNGGVKLATAGIAKAPTSLANLDSILSGSKAAALELIVHPGYLDRDFWQVQGRMSNKLTYQREQELATLTKPEVKLLLKKYEYTLDRHPN